MVGSYWFQVLDSKRYFFLGLELATVLEVVVDLLLKGSSLRRQRRDPKGSLGGDIDVLGRFLRGQQRQQ